MGNMKIGLLINKTLLNGDAVTYDVTGAPLPMTVWTVPVTGDTVTISYSFDDGVTYTTWPNGAVTTASSDVLLSGVTRLKFQRTIGTGITSTYGIC